MAEYIVQQKQFIQEYKSQYGETLDAQNLGPSTYDYISDNHFKNPILVPKNPLATQKYPKYTRTINGQNYEVAILDCSELSPESDMFQYGFPKGTHLKDITVQIHNKKLVCPHFHADNYSALYNVRLIHVVISLFHPFVLKSRGKSEAI